MDFLKINKLEIKKKFAIRCLMKTFNLCKNLIIRYVNLLF